MKIWSYSITVLLLVLSVMEVKALDRSAFYEALSGNSEQSIDNELKQRDRDKSSPLNNAFKGALLMKKAGFLKGAGSKVKMFKSGAVLLEEEIKKDPKNIEYRFIRLTIQENAPKILKYNKNLNEDKKLIIENYGKLAPDLKKVIKSYTSGSAILKMDELL